MSDIIYYECNQCGEVITREESLSMGSGGWPQHCNKDMKRLGHEGSFNPRRRRSWEKNHH
jgi:hypothetical protein